MISPATRDAICALLAADKCATDEEREAVARSLRGESTEPDVVSIKEACRRLGKSRQTIYTLVRRGRLRPVRGAGKFNTGITAQSLTDFLTHN